LVKELIYHFMCPQKVLHIFHAQGCCCSIVFKPREYDVNVPSIKDIYIILVNPLKKQTEAFHFGSLLLQFVLSGLQNFLQPSLLLLLHTSCVTSCFKSELGNMIYIYICKHTHACYLYVKIFFQCFLAYFFTHQESLNLAA